MALGGLYLTDDPVAGPDQHAIGPHSFVAGNGFAAFVADGKSGSEANHVDFMLSAQQELLGLFDSQLKRIDQLIYYGQTIDVSQGRSPDGSGRFAFHALSTPGLPNPVYTTSEVPLIQMDDVWAYDQSGEDLAQPGMSRVSTIRPGRADPECWVWRMTRCPRPFRPL